MLGKGNESEENKRFVEMMPALERIFKAVLRKKGSAKARHGLGEGTGALVGDGAGAAAANLIAKATHGSRTAGTVIGGAVGAIGGAIAGWAHDQSVIKADTRSAAQAQQGSLEQIVKLSQQGVTDAVIINQIRTSGKVYTLSANDILYLKQHNVSDAVI